MSITTVIRTRTEFVLCMCLLVISLLEENVIGVSMLGLFGELGLKSS